MFKKIVVLVLVLMMLMPQTAFANQIINNGVNQALVEYKDEIGMIANLIIAFSAIFSVLIFIIHFMRLGFAGSDPKKRSEVIQSLAISAICTAITGGFGLFFKIYLEIFTNV